MTSLDIAAQPPMTGSSMLANVSPAANAAFETGAFRQVRIAFQPIVDLRRGSVYAYEALVRGANGEGAPEVLAAVPQARRAVFDHRTMLLALFAAAKLDLRTRLALNLAPSAFVHPGTIMSLRAAAESVGLAPRHMILELSESEPLNQLRIAESLHAYRAMGFVVAIDDFGAGHAGLGLLASYQPQLLKIDMHLVRGVGGDSVRQAIIESVIGIAGKLGCAVVAEGVETEADARRLLALGIHLQQGYLYARPGLEALPIPDLSWAAF
ncbi:EAL domain-containing protein [Luteimonas sp. SX5]|uniref:EAL domain-containing protein n=2 Tax=Luteimonas galliterrae TaxID=2940486 RepID=A0ABT0MJC4_9GAMM|nr:EAL domain-containing protein [Luteimonas galliterrae]